MSRFVLAAVASLVVLLAAGAAIVEVATPRPPDEHGPRATTSTGTTDRTVQRRAVPIEGATATATSEGLPPKANIAAAVHDADGNDTLTTNIFGMPHEGLGVLRAPVQVGGGDDAHRFDSHPLLI